MAGNPLDPSMLPGPVLAFDGPDSLLQVTNIHREFEIIISL